MKILLVEDEQKLSQALSRGLGLEGYTVDTIADGKKALTRISLHRSDYDAVILDLMLPSLDGYEICKQMREMGITVPILVLTARLRALMRRPTETLPENLQVGDIELNPTERRVTRSGKKIDLTLKEFGLLEYFMRHPNQVVNREDLLNHLWDFNYVGFSNVVDVHVKNLRRKLDTASGSSALETVRGIGYRLTE